MTPIRKEDGMESFPLGHRVYPHRSLGDDTQSAFGTQNDLSQVGTGSASREKRKFKPSHRRNHSPSSKHIFNTAVVKGLLTARSGSNPAAQGRVFERLGKVAKGIAMCP